MFESNKDCKMTNTKTRYRTNCTPAKTAAPAAIRLMVVRVMGGKRGWWGVHCRKIIFFFYFPFPLPTIFIIFIVADLMEKVQRRENSSWWVFSALLLCHILPVRLVKFLFSFLPFFLFFAHKSTIIFHPRSPRPHFHLSPNDDGDGERGSGDAGKTVKKK